MDVSLIESVPIIEIFVTLFIINFVFINTKLIINS